MAEIVLVFMFFGIGMGMGLSKGEDIFKSKIIKEQKFCITHTEADVKLEKCYKVTEEK